MRRFTIDLPNFKCSCNYYLPPRGLGADRVPAMSFMDHEAASERHETWVSARQDAMRPGFHVDLADPGRPARDAGSASVTKVRFLGPVIR